MLEETLSPPITAMSAAQILHHTSAFLSEILSHPDLLRGLFSALLPPSAAQPLNLAFQSLQTSISTSSSSSLRTAVKLLLSAPRSPLTSLLLALAHHLSRRPADASLSVLDVFHSDPALARVEIAPILFQELFLVHFPLVLEWYNDRRSRILSSPPFSDSDCTGDDRSTSNATLLSRISDDQAAALRGLERDYEELLDENCRRIAEYFKRILTCGNEEQPVALPQVVLGIAEKSVSGGNEQSGGQEFGATDRRYNPIWAEAGADTSAEISSSLSRFPSLCPERVPPSVLTNHTHLDKTPDTDSEPEPEPEQKDIIRGYKHQLPSNRYYMENDANGGNQTHAPPPKDFVCPITTHVFEDPVTLETGQTYERRAIQEWLDRGNSTCPITRQPLHSGAGTGTPLPSTNYVLKRLIATWRDQNPSPDQRRPVKPVKPMGQTAMSELRLAITYLCTSQVLAEAEKAVLKISWCWRESCMAMEVQAMLAKPAVLNGFVEVLFNSVDIRVLRTAILLLTELGSRDANVVQTLTRVDSDVECMVELFKKGLPEALVLVLLLRPSATSLVEMDIVDYLVATIFKKENDDKDSPKMFVKPESAAVILLGNIIQTSSDSSLAGIVRRIVSAAGILEKIIDCLQAEDVEERIAAVSILVRCIFEDGKCRNVIMKRAELGPVLAIFFCIGDDGRFEIVNFLYELVKLNRRSLNEQILHVLKEGGSFSTMHSLLIYLQKAPPDQSPVAAGLLLQLDLLDEPRKMSIYREEAMDALISCLRNADSPIAQLSAAEVLLALQGRFSYSGKSLSRAILLKRAGLDGRYKAFMRKDQRRHNVSVEPEDIAEEEKAAEEWEKRAAFVLSSHEFGLLFVALVECLHSKYEELHSVCFMAATWLVYMLSILPDTGIRGAARLCLLTNFISIFKSEKNAEDRALSMLALNSFIHDPEGLQDLSTDMKDILKGLRELKKSSALAFEMLKVLSKEHGNSADIWNHKELSQEDCSSNGEVLAVTYFNQMIFSGHSDGTIKVWISRINELHLIQEIQEHTKAVTSLAILHSPEKLYSGSLDRTIRVWSITDERIYSEQVMEMKDQINNLVVANSMACYIPQGAGVKVHSWNGSSKLLNQNKYVKCLALMQGKLYCGCHDNSIQDIDLATGTVGTIQTGSKKLIGKSHPIHALQAHDGLIYAASPLPEGTNIKIWSMSNYSTVGSLATTVEVRTMAVSSELIYLGSKGGVVEVWCRKKMNKVETLQTSSNSRILCMAMDVNQDILVVGTSHGTIQTWELN